MDNSFESDLERILNGFESSNFLSFKYKNYFDVYVDIFSKYVNKKITFIEIGVAWWVIIYVEKFLWAGS